MSTAPPTPPTTPAGGPPPPAQTAAPEAVTLEGVVDALRPMFGSQAPNIEASRQAEARREEGQWPPPGGRHHGRGSPREGR